jgi:hypothetical protein
MSKSIDINKDWYPTANYKIFNDSNIKDLIEFIDKINFSNADTILSFFKFIQTTFITHPNELIFINDYLDILDFIFQIIKIKIERSENDINKINVDELVNIYKSNNIDEKLSYTLKLIHIKIQNRIQKELELNQLESSLNYDIIYDLNSPEVELIFKSNINNTKYRLLTYLDDDYPNYSKIDFISLHDENTNQQYSNLLELQNIIKSNPIINTLTNLIDFLETTVL